MEEMEDTSPAVTGCNNAYGSMERPLETNLWSLLVGEDSCHQIGSYFSILVTDLMCPSNSQSSTIPSM
ncbi:hypothetical protein GDO81_009992 [Engystomops pustulosus]|uniref:Uncharacterized protein n=1 Tax=Engystomops pustulosus TaxID=76066 RepID=A0AAV7BWW9_ENGPU|nr:hypothetical protein GDO81_009992 [Engystomops pustulosus]